MGSMNIPDRVDASARMIIAISRELFEIEIDGETNEFCLEVMGVSLLPFFPVNINLIIFR